MNWSFLKGLRTVIVGLGLAVVPQATTYLFSIDWTHVAGISPNAATIIGLAFVGLRAITTTAVGQSPASTPVSNLGMKK